MLILMLICSTIPMSHSPFSYLQISNCPSHKKTFFTEAGPSAGVTRGARMRERAFTYFPPPCCLYKQATVKFETKFSRSFHCLTTRPVHRNDSELHAILEICVALKIFVIFVVMFAQREYTLCNK